MTHSISDGIQALNALRTPAGPAPLGIRYAAAVDQFRHFLDAFAGAAPDESLCQELEESLARWTARLTPLAVSDRDRFWGHWPDHAGRAQALVPVWAPPPPDWDGQHFQTTVAFGRFHAGENGAAHGGAVSLLLDDFLGWLTFLRGDPPARTAALQTNYRSITPVGEPLTLSGWVERREGRKRFRRAELHHGETLCADADGLLLELLPSHR